MRLLREMICTLAGHTDEVRYSLYTATIEYRCKRCGDLWKAVPDHEAPYVVRSRRA